eukprot:TRINITY_DN7332_c0_g1_i1.p1 TRINITY_DN7332_c0_g1~~TRINITY_DN7332_c0_g1_i1.p1  ORF type:complete len:213 (+),score=33.91 TRINITY_DN7332_c0_g1_i1:336-974(+)
MVSFDVRVAGAIVLLVGLVQIVTTWPVAHGVDQAWVYFALGVPYFLLGILGLTCMNTNHSKLLSFFFWASIAFLTVCAIPLWIAYWARLHHYVNNLCGGVNCGHYKHYLGTLGALWGFLDIFVMPAVAYLTYKWWTVYTGGLVAYQDNVVPVVNGQANPVSTAVPAVYSNGTYMNSAAAAPVAPIATVPPVSMVKATTTHTTTLPQTGIPVV